MAWLIDMLIVTIAFAGVIVFAIMFTRWDV